MDNQFALGYKAGLEAAVKVCREKSELFRNTNGECIKAIEQLPVPEVQWQDLTDGEIEDLFEAVTGHSVLGGDKLAGREMYLSQNEVVAFARAVIAAFKEKNK